MGLRFRFNEDNYMFFVTTTVARRIAIFIEDRYSQVIIDNLNFYRRKYGFKLIAYVIMPDHIHLVVLPKAGTTLSNIMRDFKKYSSVQIRTVLGKDGASRLTNIFRQKANGYKGQDFKLWMDRFDNVAIYSPDILKQKIDYIHFNPAKKNLVEDILDWKYSSARNYYLDDHSVIKIDTDLIEI